MKKNAQVAIGITMPSKNLIAKISIVLLFLISSSISVLANTEITGNIVDKDGQAIKDVKVFLEKDEVAITDEQGVFAFSTEKIIGKIYQIVFFKEGYNKAVRNYSIQMENANYMITMYQPCKCKLYDSTKCFSNDVNFIFESKTSKVSDTDKKKLDKIIQCLIQNPEKEISITYNTMYQKRVPANDKLMEIKKYFMTKGIIDDRVKTKITSELSIEENLVEIKNE